MCIEYDPSRSALYTPEKRETLFETGKTYSPLQLAMEGARLAYYRAEKSQSQAQRLRAALACVGFAEATMFVDAGTGAAGFGSLRSADNVALVALRGTQPDDCLDLECDLEAVMVAWPESKGRVHAGFAKATRALLPQIRQWLEQSRIKSDRLIVTGHSLGAAMATLVASALRPEWLVTLGSPRVGNADFVASVSAKNVRRIVDCCDVVTELPPPLGGYVHLATCTYLTRNAQELQNPAEAVIHADRFGARLEYLTHWACKLGTVPVRDLADHAPINYARGFFPCATASG